VLFRNHRGSPQTGIADLTIAGVSCSICSNRSVVQRASRLHRGVRSPGGPAGFSDRGSYSQRSQTVRRRGGSQFGALLKIAHIANENWSFGGSSGLCAGDHRIFRWLTRRWWLARWRRLAWRRLAWRILWRTAILERWLLPGYGYGYGPGYGYGY
jgi:hypothetical protein